MLEWSHSWDSSVLCNDVTIYLISIVTTIIMVIADPILCNANRDAREFIISTFKWTIVLLLIRAVLAVVVTVAKLRHTDAFSSITSHFALRAFCAVLFVGTIIAVLAVITDPALRDALSAGASKLLWFARLRSSASRIVVSKNHIHGTRALSMSMHTKRADMGTRLHETRVVN